MAKEIFTAEWFPYYFERFEASDRVAVMSLAEEGAYHRAIRLAWKHGYVPADPKALAAKIQKRCTDKIAAVVLTMFEPSPADPKRMIHPTVEEIRVEQEQKYLNRVKGGKASAKVRKKVSENNAAASVANKHTSSIAQYCSNNTSTHKEIEIKREKETKKDSSEEESFKEIDSYVHACVEAYPNFDPRLVEIAVLETLFRRKGSLTEHRPIKSLKYFEAEIKQMCSPDTGGALSSNTIDAMLQSRREKIQATKQQRISAA